MHRSIAAFLTLSLGLLLAGCYPYPPADDPYGAGSRPPRYGHGGTDSPRGGGIFSRNERLREEQDRAQQQAQAQSQAQQPTSPDTAGDNLETPSDSGTAGAGDTAAAGGGTSAGGSTSGASNQASGSGSSSSGGSSSGGALKYGTPVPGKPGFIYSPNNPDGGHIDIRVENPDGTMGTLPPGTRISDPFFKDTPILVP